LGYRLKHDPPDPGGHQDGLPENPTKQEITVFDRDYSHLESLRVYPIGDLHIGGPEHASDQLDEWLQYLADAKNASMLNTGDNTNCAIKTSVSETYDERMSVGEAREMQTAKFKPLAEANKIDAVIDGNHEDRIYRATGDSPNAAVCQALGINYERATCVVRYTVGDQQYDVYLRHGTGGGRKIGSAINNLQDQENVIDADIYVSGHTHTQVAFVKDIFVPTDEGFDRKKRLFVCSASFVGYEEYAKKAGYAPAHIGAPRLYLDGRRKDAHASV
jgi:predicted phosphodiesterase